LVYLVDSSTGGMNRRRGEDSFEWKHNLKLLESAIQSRNPEVFHRFIYRRAAAGKGGE
jgi:hypothetical protein